MPVCIAGMHRAGTSMVARLLEGCGTDLGGPAHFAPPAPDNREGYWEDLRFLALNERILDRLGGAWDHPPDLAPGWESSPILEPERREAHGLVSGRAEPWGWKDPRNSLLLPFWRRIVPGLKVVVCLRNPLEVADSLRARGYTSERFGLELWEAYHRALEAATLDSPALVTHYESYFADPRAELDRLLEFLGLEASPGVRAAVVTAASAGFRHQRRMSAEVQSSRLSEAAKQLYDALCRRSGPIYDEARRREEKAPPPPPARADGPKGLAEQLADVKAVLSAREMELASIKPVLVARSEEVASVKEVLAARDAHLASVLPVLAARETELASAMEELAAVKAALSATNEQLATARAELRSVRGILGALQRIVRARLVPSTRDRGRRPVP